VTVLTQFNWYLRLREHWRLDLGPEYVRSDPWAMAERELEGLVASIESAYAQAHRAANGKDVRLGVGVATIALSTCRLNRQRTSCCGRTEPSSWQ
jgi:hypothetical protein